MIYPLPVQYMTMLEYIRIRLTRALKKDAVLFATDQWCEKHAREEYY